MRAAPKRAMSFALSALVGVGSALASCTGEPPTTYCVFENEALQGGRCLTECESRCNLERIAGCSSDTCVTDCDKAASTQSSACLDASYSYWRCLRTSGQPQVTCDGEVPVFSVPEHTCHDQLETMGERCLAIDGGPAADSGG